MSKYGTDTSKLAQKVKARKAADAALELLIESIEGDVEHFWRIVRDHAVKQSPVAAATNGPMTDKEAQKFGLTVMPFGKFTGIPVEAVPVYYLDWLVGQPDEFKENLKRYVQNDDVRRRFQDKLEEDE